MSFKQNKHRAVKKAKKEMKENGSALLSSSGEGRHYERRSQQRSQNGGVVPFYSKKLKKMVRRGSAKIIRKDSKTRRIQLPSGDIIIVDKKLGKAITFLGN